MEKIVRSVPRVEELEGSEKVFQDAVNAGNLDGLLSLYEPDAVFVPAPDQVARGLDAIRQAWDGLLHLDGRFELTTITRHQVGDIALGTDRWKLEGHGPDGNPITLSGVAAVIHHRQPDGSWRLIIDNAFPLG